MLRNKDIKNLSELKSAFVSAHKKSEFFISIIDVLKIGKFHPVFSTVKKKGIPPLVLVKILITEKKGKIKSYKFGLKPKHYRKQYKKRSS